MEALVIPLGIYFFTCIFRKTKDKGGVPGDIWKEVDRARVIRFDHRPDSSVHKLLYAGSGT